jgi:predicted ABC-type ATPase
MADVSPQVIVIALGLSAFKPEAAAIESGRIMLKRLRDLASREENFAFETTLATRSYATWLRRLKRQGYNFHLIFLWLGSPELALRRVRERVLMGGHDVPEGIVRRRYVKGIGATSSGSTRRWQTRGSCMIIPCRERRHVSRAGGE